MYLNLLNKKSPNFSLTHIFCFSFRNDAIPNPIPKLYLKCPAAVLVQYLKKFLQIKFELSGDKQIDIIYDDECLKDSFSLMDIVYTFGWNRVST